MSHYTVLVIHDEGQSVDDMLAPYDENMECDPQKIYMSEEDTKRMKEYYEKQENKELSLEDLVQHMESWNGSTDSGVEDGQLYYYSSYNQDSKWDWYQIGGRWSGMIPLLPEKTPVLAGERSWCNKEEEIEPNYCDSAKVKDIDWNTLLHGTNEQRSKSARFWELYIEEQEPVTDEDKEMLKFVFYKKEYYVECYGTKERYIDHNNSFSTYAVLNDEGWHEAGQMGWFGCSSATPEDQGKFVDEFYNTFLQGLPENKVLTIVDCHI